MQSAALTKLRAEYDALATGGGMALGFSGLFLAVPVAGVLVAMRKGWFEARASGAEGAPELIRSHPKVQEVYFGSGKTFERPANVAPRAVEQAA